MASGAIFFGGGDLLLVIFTLTVASAFLIIAAFSSNSPYAQVGAERELLQMMAYEPMVLMTAIGFYMYCGSFTVGDIPRRSVDAVPAADRYIHRIRVYPDHKVQEVAIRPEYVPSRTPRNW